MILQSLVFLAVESVHIEVAITKGFINIRRKEGITIKITNKLIYLKKE